MWHYCKWATPALALSSSSTFTITPPDRSVVPMTGSDSRREIAPSMHRGKSISISV